MKIKMLKIVAAGLLILSVGLANAGVIITTFNDDKGSSGNMFNLTTFSDDLLLTGSGINLIGSGAQNVSIYSRVGGCEGFELDASSWALQGTEGVLGVGRGGGHQRKNVTSFPAIKTKTQNLLHMLSAVTGMWKTNYIGNWISALMKIA